MIDWAALKQRLSLDESQKDTVVALERAAVAQAERIVQRKLAKQTVTAIIKCSGASAVLPDFPIHSIASLKDEDGDEVEHKLIDKNAGIVRLPQGSGDRYLTCEYVGGYDPVPDDIQAAIVEIVSWNIGRYKGNTIGIRGKKFEGGYDVSLELTIPLNAVRILEAYRSVA